MRPVHIFGILLKNMNFPSLKSHSGWHLLQRTPLAFVTEDPCFISSLL